LEIAMKTSLKWIAAFTLACTALAAPANEEHHKEDAKPAKTAKANKPSDKSMNEQMQKLQAARDKLTTARTPAARQMAMTESMHAMKDSMSMMRDMGGKGCMDMGKGMGMNMGADKMTGSEINHTYFAR
jgi:hypothetical protein